MSFLVSALTASIVLVALPGAGSQEMSAGPAGPLAAVPARPAAGTPYRHGQAGYDSSFPQCGSPASPPGAAFGVVGLNRGRAFTLNPCVAAELLMAPARPAVYLNSGYDTANLVRVTPGCRAAADQRSADQDHRDAWAIGCTEAEYDLQQLPVKPSMWWLDVEEYNSWSADTTLNGAALTGLTDRLSPTGAPIGVYSSRGQWNRLLGSFHHVALRGSWIATGDRPERYACQEPGLAGTPVRLVQMLDPVADGAGVTDADLAC